MIKQWLSQSYLRYPQRLYPRGMKSFYASLPSMHKREDFIWVEGENKQSEARLVFYLLIDRTDGVIADIRFQGNAPFAYIGIADVACELLIRSHYQKIKRLKPIDLIEPIADEKERLFCHILPSIAAFVLTALDHALLNSPDDLPPSPVMEERETPLMPGYGEEISFSYDNWPELSDEERRKILEGVIAKEIAPYVALDEGSVHIVEIRHGIEVVIGYAGSCTTCHSSTGSTLNAIAQILKQRVYPHLIIIPDPSLLH